MPYNTADRPKSSNGRSGGQGRRKGPLFIAGFNNVPKSKSRAAAAAGQQMFCRLLAGYAPLNLLTCALYNIYIPILCYNILYTLAYNIHIIIMYLPGRVFRPTPEFRWRVGEGRGPRYIEISSSHNACDNKHFYGMKRSFNIHAVYLLYAYPFLCKKEEK